MPAPPAPRTLTVDLSCDLTAPRAARHLLAAVLPQWGVDDPEVLDGASIVVSELVTNVLVHGGSGALTLSLELREKRLTLAVADEAPGVPAPRQAADDEESGRGLGIVTLLAESWDVEPTPAGKRVVVAIPLPAAWCA